MNNQPKKPDRASSFQTAWQKAHTRVKFPREKIVFSGIGFPNTNFILRHGSRLLSYLFLSGKTFASCRSCAEMIRWSAEFAEFEEVSKPNPVPSFGEPVHTNLRADFVCLSWWFNSVLDGLSNDLYCLSYRRLRALHQPNQKRYAPPCTVLLFSELIFSVQSLSFTLVRLVYPGRRYRNLPHLLQCVSESHWSLSDKL